MKLHITFFLLATIAVSIAICITVLGGLEMTYTQFPCNITESSWDTCYKPNSFHSQYWYRQSLTVNNNISAELNCYDDDWCNICKSNYTIGTETTCYQNYERVILGYCCPISIMLIGSSLLWLLSLLCVVFGIHFYKRRNGYDILEDE